MSNPSQGFLESDEAYKERIATEERERNIELESGERPSQGFFESDESYRQRLRRGSYEADIRNGSEEPKQGWLESDQDYESRIWLQSRESIIAKLQETRPSQGFFEDDATYRRRVSREADEAIIEHGNGRRPSQGIFESDKDYRDRIWQQARELRAAREPEGSGEAGSSYESPSYTSDSSSTGTTSNSGGKPNQTSFLSQSFGWAVVIAVVYLLVIGLGASSEGSNTSSTRYPTEVVRAPGLNLRSGPDRTSDILVTLTQGEAVQVMGTAISRTGAEWAHVQARGMEGWVTREYLSGAAAPAGVAAEKPESSSPTRTRISLQYQLPRDADNLAAIRSALEGHSDWRVVGTERVLPAGENKPETYAGVRFFFESDSVLARTVCEEVVAEFGRQGYSVTLPIWPMLTRQRLGLFQARPGLIEVWVDPLPDSPAPREERPLPGQCGR